MTTEEQIELARKFAGRFTSALTSGAILGTASVCDAREGPVQVSKEWMDDLALLARAETLLAEADAKPAERVCEWKLDSMEWYLPTCQLGISRAHLEDLCPHCGGRVKVKDGA